MENVHAVRSAGWSALAFVVVAAVAVILLGSTPPVTTKPADLALFVDVHRTGILWGAWLTFPAAAFFLWFAVGLTAYLREVPGRREGLPALVLGFGVVSVACAFMSAFLQSAVAYEPPDAFAGNGLAGIYTALIFTTQGLGWAPISIFFLSAAASMRRHHSAPVWLVWLGYLAALGTALATLTIFFTDPAMSPTGLAGALAGSLPAVAWFVATGIVLIRLKEPAPGASAG